MSLINDALKQARKAAPRNTPSALPPQGPVADDPSPVAGWLLPAIVILLIIAAIFFLGWAVAHHTVRAIVAAPPANDATQQVAGAAIPLLKPPPAEPPPPINPPDAPKLQGIFYSPTSPSAIIDGKIVHPGDQYQQYRVKTISKYTVTLIGPDKKEIQIGMDN
jgi:hypothetical protein